MRSSSKHHFVTTEAHGWAVGRDGIDHATLRAHRARRNGSASPSVLPSRPYHAARCEFARVPCGRCGEAVERSAMEVGLSASSLN